MWCHGGRNGERLTCPPPQRGASQPHNLQGYLVHKNLQGYLVHKNLQGYLVHKNLQGYLVHKTLQGYLVHKKRRKTDMSPLQRGGSRGRFGPQGGSCPAPPSLRPYVRFVPENIATVHIFSLKREMERDNSDHKEVPAPPLLLRLLYYSQA